MVTPQAALRLRRRPHHAEGLAQGHHLPGLGHTQRILGIHGLLAEDSTQGLGVLQLPLDGGHPLELLLQGLTVEDVGLADRSRLRRLLWRRRARAPLGGHTPPGADGLLQTACQGLIELQSLGILERIPDAIVAEGFFVRTHLPDPEGLVAPTGY